MKPDVPKTYRVLVLDNRPDEYQKDLIARFPTVSFTFCRQPDDIQRTVEDSRPHIVFGLVGDGMPGPPQRAVFKSPRLEWIQTGNVGVDHLKPWPEQPPIVSNTAGVLSPFMAETVIGAILTLNFGFHRYLEQQRHHIWKVRSWKPVRGKTILIVGLGHIGRCVASHAKALGMRVFGVRRTSAPAEFVDEIIPFSGMHEVLPSVDVISLHVPLTSATRHIIDKRVFERLPESAILINTSRGGVVDEYALEEALVNREIAGAYMDVFAEEPLPEDSPLWEIDNLLISPHCSDAADGWHSLFAAFFADNLERWLEGRPLKNVLDLQRGY